MRDSLPKAVLFIMKSPRQKKDTDDTPDGEVQELFERLASDGVYVEWDTCQKMLLLRGLETDMRFLETRVRSLFDERLQR